jgi:LacI family transcriptional regulator
MSRMAGEGATGRRTWHERATRDDVAARAGVSSATVSYVVNNGPRPVAPETRARVLAAIAELGYHPDNIARSLRVRQTHVLGLVLPDSANLFFAELARRLELRADELGYSLLLCNSQEDVEREATHLAALRDQRVDGIILVPADAPDGSVPSVLDGIPVVALDRAPPDWTGDSVRTDARQGGALVARHLLGLGHRRIGFIHGPLRLAHARERLEGALLVLREAAVQARPEWSRPSSFDFAGGWEAAQALLSQPDHPTALCCSNDAMAIGALAALHARGHRVPSDMSVTGFDDVPLATYAIPALTTVAQPFDAMAATALATLLERVGEVNAGGPGLPPRQQTLAIGLVVRGSTGPARA